MTPGPPPVLPRTLSPVARVLVVDDHEKNRAVAAALLDLAGYEVALAPGGDEALASFTERTPDLVLLDIVMPGMDGFEACRRLRALPRGDEVPIVFLTALDEPSVHDRALDAGADDFLTKPIHRTELLMRVRSLLRIRRLAGELRAGYDTIRAQRDALERAQSQKEEVFTLVVHDLKNPLTGIRLHAQLAERMVGMPDDAKKSLTFIMGASDTMQRMVMNLLDIGRSDDGALVAACSEVDVLPLLTEVCDDMQGRAAEDAHHLTVVGSTEVGEARLDRDLVRRVLENLVDNALKYTPPGGHVQLEARRTADGLELEVRDDGPGIPEAHRERVFEKYVRLGAGDDDAESRTSRGLGLVFCRRAAEAHGGTICVAATEGPGTTFRVSLPLAGPASRRT